LTSKTPREAETFRVLKSLDSSCPLAIRQVAELSIGKNSPMLWVAQFVL